MYVHCNIHQPQLAIDRLHAGCSMTYPWAQQPHEVQTEDEKVHTQHVLHGMQEVVPVFVFQDVYAAACKCGRHDLMVHTMVFVHYQAYGHAFLNCAQAAGFHL
jgi:hypothetical protein